MSGRDGIYVVVTAEEEFGKIKLWGPFIEREEAEEWAEEYGKRYTVTFIRMGF